MSKSITEDSELDKLLFAYEKAVVDMSDERMAGIRGQIMALIHKSNQEAEAKGFINGAEFELLELLNHAAYSYRKTVDVKTISDRLSDITPTSSDRET